MVGRLSTMAVSVSPEMIAGSSPPIELMIGLSATRTGYLNRMARSCMPLERAVITYCLLSSSSSEPRRMRITSAVPAVPITMNGIGRCLSRSTTLPRLQSAAMYSRENSPPGLQPK